MQGLDHDAEASATHLVISSGPNASRVGDVAVKSEPVKRTPDIKQLEVLRVVVERCICEAEAEAADLINTCVCNSVLAIAHGLPGSGKSRVMHLLRELLSKNLVGGMVEISCVQRP